MGTETDRRWYFGTVEDVPGASKYSTSTTRQFLFNATSPEKEDGEVVRQHVMGEKEDPEYWPEYDVEENRTRTGPE